jgi:hypothetical protein
LDNGWSPNQRFWGIYTTWINPHAGSANVDFYYLGKTRDSVRYARGTANETRQTLGARVWWRTGAWNADIEAAWQFGRFGPGQLRAWTVATAPTYTFYDARWSPSLIFNFTAASGDGDPSSGTLGTFSPPEPRGQYFARINAVGPLNIIALWPSVAIVPVSALTLTTGLYAFWRAKATDGVYRVPGALIRPSAPGLSRFLGTQLQTIAEIRLSRQVLVTLNPAWFLTGASLDAPPRGQDITYAAALIAFRF